MPNVNRPQGLSPVEYLDGTPYNGKARMYFIAQFDVNAYAIGDPVVPGGTADSRGVANITLATAGAGNAVLGAIVGAPGVVYGGSQIDPTTTGASVIVPATKTKGYYVLVSDDPRIVYEIQEGGAGAALAATNVWQNANLLSGANSGFQSGWLLDNNSTGTGATLQLQILGLMQRSYDEYGAFAKWKVRINVHPFQGGTTGF